MYDVAKVVADGNEWDVFFPAPLGCSEHKRAVFSGDVGESIPNELAVRCSKKSRLTLQMQQTDQAQESSRNTILERQL